MGWTSQKARLMYSRAYYAANRERLRDYQRRWYAANKEKLCARSREIYTSNKEHKLALCQAAYRRAVAKGKRYGKDYPAPTRRPAKACECCGRKQKRALSLDHCHATRKFRGWLCGQCNVGIGMLGDNAVGIRRALRYLKRGSK